MPNPIINVVLACDEKYSAHAATVVASIVETADLNDILAIHLFSNRMDDEIYTRIVKFATARPQTSIFRHELEHEVLFDLPDAHHGRTAYVRLLACEMLSETERLIYLDSDLIVLESLSELATMDLRGFIVAAAPDAMQAWGRTELADYKANIGVPFDHVYFNSGVLVIDTNKWRSSGLQEKLKSCVQNTAERMKELKTTDQGPLNIVLQGRTLYLHPRWNFQVSVKSWLDAGLLEDDSWKEATNSPAIVHYITRRKPWDWKYVVPYRRLYWKFRKRWDPSARVLAGVSASDWVSRIIGEGRRCRQRLGTLKRFFSGY